MKKLNGYRFFVVAILFSLFNFIYANESIEILSKEVGLNLSQCNTHCQQELSDIFSEFKKRNPTAKVAEFKEYWKNILKSVEIKNKITGDMAELEEGKKAIKRAVSQAGISHSLRGTEGKVYKYFKYKLELFKKIGSNEELKQIVLEGEKEFSKNKKGKEYYFYSILDGITKDNIKTGVFNNLGKYTSIFFKEISNKKYPVFSKEFYDVIEKEKRISEKEKRISEKEKRISEKEKRISEKEKKVAEKQKKVAEKQKKVAEKEKKVAEKEKRIKQAKELLKMIGG